MRCQARWRVPVAAVIAAVGVFLPLEPVMADDPIFDVGRDGNFESSWTYTDTVAWDSFNDITAFDSTGCALGLENGVPITDGMDRPDTDVLYYNEYQDGDFGRMFVGFDLGGPSVFSYLVDSDAMNELRSGQSGSDVFDFTFCGDEVVSFTVNVVGADDRPQVERELSDITDDAPRTETDRFRKIPALPGSAFGFSGSDSYDTPDGEKVERAFDGLASTKYLNFGKTNTDVLIDMGAGHIVTGIALVTANDSPERDPSSVAVYGSDETFPSAEESDISDWMETASQIGDTVSLSPPAARLTTYSGIELSNPNRVAFRYFRILFPTVRNQDDANSMQIAEIRLIGNKSSSEERFLQGAGDVKINGDTTVKAERPTSARMTIEGAITGDTLSCGACAGYTDTWNGGSFTLDIVDENTTYSASAIVDAIRSVRFENTSHSGARTVPSIRLVVRDANGLDSLPIDFDIVMGLPRTLNIGVSGGDVPESLPQGGATTMVSTPSAGSGVVSYQIESGNCSVSGSRLIMGSERCVVTSEISMDGVYARTFSANRLEIESAGVLPANGRSSTSTTTPTTVKPNTPNAGSDKYWIRVNRQEVLSELSNGEQGYSLVGGGVVFTILNDRGLNFAEGDEVPVRFAGLEPGSTVRVFFGAVEVGTIKVDAQGIAKGTVRATGSSYEFVAQSSSPRPIDVVVRGTRAGGDQVAAMIQMKRTDQTRLPATGSSDWVHLLGVISILCGLFLSRSVTRRHS